MKPKVIFLVGPTACGKSEIAIELASKINAEIISCDSMQVYKGMEILSAVVSFGLRRKVKHHLISYINPQSQYNVAKFRKQALKKIKEILKKGKIPLFVGGSGLYYKALLDGIFMEEKPDKRLRDRLYKEAERYGTHSLYERLKSIDPQSSLKIHPHDLKRIVRALEVYEKTGIPISEWQKKAKGIFDEYEVKIFGILRPKEVILKRIKKRTEKMFKKGLVKEVKRLLKLKLSRTAKEAIGIKEILGYLEGEYSLTQAKNLIIKNTLKLVKKQLTWFKKDKRIQWIYIDKDNNYKKIAQIILEKIN